MSTSAGTVEGRNVESKDVDINVSSDFVNMCKTRYAISAQPNDNGIVITAHNGLWRQIGYQYRNKEHFPYAVYINSLLPDTISRIDPDSKSFQNRAAVTISRIESKMSKMKKGRQWQVMDQKFATLQVFSAELISVTRLEELLLHERKTLAAAKENVQQQENSKKFFQQSVVELSKIIAKHEHNIDKTKSALKGKVEECKQLQCAVANLQKNGTDTNLEPKLHTGKPITEVSPRQAQRQLKQIQSCTEDALWFYESFGVELDCVVVHDKNQRKFVIDSVHNKITKSNGQITWSNQNYFKLTNAEKEKVKRLVHILDANNASNEFYAELSKFVCSLPSITCISECRQVLDTEYKIVKTPGGFPGAQVSVLPIITKMLRQKKKGEPLRLKIEGDGTQVTRLTSWVIFSLVDVDNTTAMSCQGHIPIAVLKTKEDYAKLKAATSDVVRDIQAIVTSGGVCIHEKFYPVEVFFGADMKFLLILLGMLAANSNQSCIWCFTAKKDRWDVSKTQEHYNETIARSLTSMQSDYQAQKNGCAKEPILSIQPINIIIDVLHALLRITDRLEENLMFEVLDRDDESNFGKQNKDRVSLYLDKLVFIINDIGVSFAVWKKKSAAGRELSVFEWTSLTGNEKLKLLTLLPARLPEVLYPNTCNKIMKLWKDFSELYNLLRCCKSCDKNKMSKQVATKAKDWVKDFYSIPYRKGYETSRVTPYMHAVACHAPQQILKHGCLGRFSGQAVEKQNDTMKTILHKHTNKWDAAADVLRIRLRGEETAKYKRKKRTYCKRNTPYWKHGITEERKKRLRISL